MHHTSESIINHFAVRLIMLFVMMVAGNIIFFGIGGLVAIQVWDVNVLSSPAVLQQINNPGIVPVVRFFQVVQTIGMFLLPGIGWIVLYESPLRQGLMLKDRLTIESVLGLFLVIVAALPMINALAGINEMLRLPDWLSAIEENLRYTEAKAMEFMEALLEVNAVSTMFVNLFVIGLVPAVSEEVFFRGVLQNEVERITSKPVLAVLIAACVFSAMHYQFFTFLPRFVLGIMMGLVYLWSRNLWVPVLLHFFNNGISVVFWYVFSPEIIDKELDSIGTFSYMWPLAIVSIVFVILIMYGLNRHYGENRKIIPKIRK